MTKVLSGGALVAGVVGSPIRHSLSPLLHNAWIQATGLDAVYVPFSPHLTGFKPFAEGMAGGAIRGLNVTAPFKEAALHLAHVATPRAGRAGAANLLLFDRDGVIRADNTDGEGLLNAFAEQAPGFSPTEGPMVVLGAGGAARGAVAAFLDAGAPEVRVVNRSAARGQILADLLGDRVRVFIQADWVAAMTGAAAVINATPLGQNGVGTPDIPLEAVAARCVIMDMVYRPLHTGLLKRAAALGLPIVDGLAMLIGQARPSFEAFFGKAPPDIDVRALALAHLESRV